MTLRFIKCLEERAEYVDKLIDNLEFPSPQVEKMARNVWGFADKSYFDLAVTVLDSHKVEMWITEIEDIEAKIPDSDLFDPGVN